jgi:hypothetical protein
MRASTDKNERDDWSPSMLGPKGPDHECNCGSVNFRLRYGEYCLWAKCRDCGEEQEVYSG